MATSSSWSLHQGPEQGQEARNFRYQSEWDEEFRAETDMDIVIENVSLPVHSVLLCQSPILRAALRDTYKSGRLQLKSTFKDLPLNDMDMLLSHVYPSSSVLVETSLQEYGTVLPLAIKYGFKVVEKRVLNVLSMRKQRLPQELTTKNPESVYHWVRLAMQTGCPSLTADVAKFLAEHFHTILGPRREERWQGLEEVLNENGWRAVAESLGALLDVQGRRPVLLEYRCTNCKHFFEGKECSVSELLDQENIYGGAQFMCKNCGSYINCSVYMKRKNRRNQ